MGPVALNSVAERVHPNNAALIVIDMQKDFCSPGGASTRRGGELSVIEEMVPRLLNLIEEARRVGMRILYTKHINSQWSDSPAWMTRASHRSGFPPGRPVGEGADFAPGFRARENEAIVFKHRSDSFLGTDLDLILSAQGVKSVILTGVATSGCVEATAKTAFRSNYYVVCVGDCCGTGREAHEAALKRIDAYCGLRALVSAREVLAEWRTLPAQPCPITERNISANPLA